MCGGRLVLQVSGILVVFLSLALSGCGSSSVSTTPDSAVKKDTGPPIDMAQQDLVAGDLGDGRVPDLWVKPDSGPLTCWSCHGTVGNAAPPKSLYGQTSTSERGVGAHQAHLGTSTWHAEVLCSDCHKVPANYLDPGHVDTNPPAELTFSPMVTTDGAKPAWDGTTCSGSYCHGATLSGGKAVAPTWTLVDGTQKACDSCHGMPPTSNHSTSTDCVNCHPAVIDANKKIIAPALHINGKVEFTKVHPADWGQKTNHGPAFFANTSSCGGAGCHGTNLAGAAGPSCTSCHPGWSSCSFCHGSATNAAPPEGVLGATLTTDKSVGAHQQHLGTSTWHVEIKCGDCHKVPTQVFDPGHIDSPLPAELTYGPAWKYKNATPTWNGTTCGTYCHGVTLSGGKATSPLWTKVDGTQKACDSCHGMPPTQNHTTATTCSVCHAAVVDATNKIIAPNLHINGTVEATKVHPAGWNAKTVHGPAFFQSSSSCGGAGCHGNNLTGGAGPSCASCHSNWQTCSFCHGSATNAAPSEGVLGATATTTRQVGAHQQHLGTSTWHVEVKCTDCHKVPTNLFDAGHIDTYMPAEVSPSAAWKYDNSAASWNGATCTSYCHGTTLSGGKATTPTWTKVDGTQKACDSCHGMPPTQNHTTSTACSNCHGTVVNGSNQIIAANLHINGTVEVTAYHPTGWSAKTAHGAAFNSGTQTCSGSACHGATLTGGAGQSCQTCHSGWQNNCTFCHGGTDNTTGAPPETVDGQTAASVPGVGRHSKHVMTGTATRYDCSICHVKPTDAFSVGHIDPRPGDVTFSGLAAGTNYNYTTYQCTNIYCHGNGNGTNGSAPWVGAYTNNCSSCHPAVPSSGKHSRHVNAEGYACSECHSCVVASGSTTITNQALHVDGKKDYCGPAGFNATTKRCTLSCHGENHSSDRW